MFDGNGNWTSDFSAQADRDNGIKILASRFDNIFIADIKESFENCLTKDGQIAPIGDFNMGGQRLINLDDGINAKDAVNKSQLDTAIDTTVKLTGDQTIAGTKTFSSSPIVPTPAADDSSQKTANTAWVKNYVPSFAIGYPDYTARVSKNANTNYTAEFDGLLYIFGTEGYRKYNMTINGVEYPYIYHGGDGYSSGELTFFVKQGDTFRITGAGSNTIYLIPYRQ